VQDARARGLSQDVTEAPRFDDAALQPFLKWAGGKQSLFSQLEPHFPARWNRYFEPFLGGGAVFLRLRPNRARLSDINPRLIDCYRAIRDDVDEVIGALEGLRATHSHEQYYAARERMNRGEDATGAPLTRVERAALQVYLNKTCYNGLYRENSRGHFNVPIGSYTNPSIFDEDNLRAVSQSLRGADIACEPFESILDSAQRGDFVYLDPPYAPLSTTSSFTAYSKHGFDDADQKRLSEVCRELDRRGCFFLQSNSDAPRILDLYRGFAIDRVRARRNINSKARRRGPIDELVISNYR
jgi:DNA adenine methylase